MDESESGIIVLKKAALSSLLMGAWGLATCSIVLTPVFGGILALLHWFPGTYVELFHSYFIGYVILATATVPFLLCFGGYSYKVGKHIGMQSLKLAGAVWIAIAATSLALIPLVYGDAIAAMAAYSESGLLYSVTYDPLVLPTIRVATAVFFWIALVTFVAGNGELRYRTGIIHFSTAFLLAFAGVFLMVLFPLAIITYGLGLHRMYAPKKMKRIPGLSEGNR